MKIHFNPEEILQTLSFAACVINGKSTMPILDCFCIKADGDHSTITASDGEMWVSARINIKSDSEFVFCINAQQFIKALRNLEGGLVNGSLDENIASFEYNDGYFKMPYITDDFPQPPTDAFANGCAYTMSETTLQKALSSVAFAVSNDALRPVMNGVHFDFTPTSIIAVATDTHRLAKFQVENCGNPETTDSITIPAKVASILRSISPVENADVSINFNDKYIAVKGDGYTVASRLVEGRYPNYAAIIPSGGTRFAKIMRQSLISAMKRVAPMGDETSELVRFEFTSSKTLVLTAENVDFSTSAKEEVQCDYDGVPLTIGVKSSIFVESVRSILADEIYIEMTDADRAFIIHGGDKIANMVLMMPLCFR